MDDDPDRHPLDPRVDDRVLEMLSESSGRIAFNGLRRALGVHPESLSRALRRLERDGTVTRGSGGYSLRMPPPEDRDEREGMHTIASVELPRESAPEELLGRLAGRWLGGLRWMGVYDHPGRPSLVWTVEGTADRVLLCLRGSVLAVLTDAPAERSARPEEAAYRLLARAVEAVRASSRPGAPSPGLLTFSRSAGPTIASIPN